LLQQNKASYTLAINTEVNMNKLILAQTESLTMSHTQIAELVKSRPDSVKRTMERLCEKGVIQLTPMVEVNHKGQTVNVYAVNERDSYVVVAQLSPEFTAYLVDEWTSRKKPKLMTPTQLAMMVIKAEEEKAELLVEVDRLQGVCQTITAQFAKGVTAPKFCKQLQGVNTQQVNNALIEFGILTRKQDGVIPTAYSRDKYFAEKQEEFNGKLRSHSALTLQGAKWLYRAYLSNKLPMKSNWDGSFIHMVFEG
jgi:phage regulator Rha-like protein